MKKAIELGKRALGSTGDNPSVGCIIVFNGNILGMGMTHPPGGPHAEISALSDANQQNNSVAGATLYSTVEPCTFFGRTPPCTKAIIEKKIQRVVIGIRDPHPRVQGSGVRQLQDAGIEVTENVCQALVKDYLSEWLRSYLPL
ncbi:MAG: riboflavin biosynthesis protein RibD [SAR324 cluster bacterium]|nr:riboflavin biosynthesis protein RibD [SAR324 cluster bacterium]